MSRFKTLASVRTERRKNWKKREARDFIRGRKRWHPDESLDTILRKLVSYHDDASWIEPFWEAVAEMMAAEELVVKEWTLV